MCFRNYKLFPLHTAEITDKLGLHSLRNRNWVCPRPLLFNFACCL